MVDIIKEIQVEEFLFSASTKIGYYVGLSTKGMEKFGKKNLLIITPDIFIIQSKKIILIIADYILNQHEIDSSIELYNLSINDEYPPVNLKFVTLNNTPYYLINSRSIIDGQIEKLIKEKIRSKSEDDIETKSKFYVIKGGKT